uniref:Lipoprotein n=1 Tax=Caenorhabditis tropicalis TaxID=1561998 RepID=A0A1I7UFG7_9PELO
MIPFFCAYHIFTISILGVIALVGCKSKPKSNDKKPIKPSSVSKKSKMCAPVVQPPVKSTQNPDKEEEPVKEKEKEKTKHSVVKEAEAPKKENESEMKKEKEKQEDTFDSVQPKNRMLIERKSLVIRRRRRTKEIIKHGIR